MRCIKLKNSGFELITFHAGFRFNATKMQTVTESFRGMNRWFWAEMMANGFILGSVFLFIRVWLGASIADDGLGIITGRFSPNAETAFSAKSYLFLIFGVAAALSFSIGGLSRRLARQFFGTAKNNESR